MMKFQFNPQNRTLFEDIGGTYEPVAVIHPWKNMIGTEDIGERIAEALNWKTHR